MTLGEYLDRYKALINKYFSDTEKYAEERAQALHDFLAEMKGYYDSAISGVTTLIDHKIKGVQKQKDAALKAIEAERKAATEAYEKRIEEIDKVIKQKNKDCTKRSLLAGKMCGYSHDAITTHTAPTAICSIAILK